MIPKDPVMLLSYLNTQLRDHYETLDELCKTLNLDRTALEDKLAMIQYRYDAEKNQFI